MTVHRKRPVRPRDDHSTRVTTLGALGMPGAAGGDLGAAAQIIADKARELSSAWSAQIPGRIQVSVTGKTATVSCDAPPAYPGETRARHPLFGDRDRWYGPPGEPFLAPAATQSGDKAMARYAQKIDKWAAAAGYR